MSDAENYWRTLTPEDLTDDFVKFVSTLQEIEEVQPFMKMQLRHFRVKGFCLNENFITKYYKYVEKDLFQAREDDTYVISFPKTGTTWVQQIVYLITNNCDYEANQKGYLTDKFPFLEMKYTLEERYWDAPSPRLMKSHLPLSLLPSSIMKKKSKIIYIARNPKDAIISYYHFAKMLNYFTFPGTLKEFVSYFLRGFPPFAPYENHALEFWESRHEPNILFLKYEDLQKDLSKEIRKVAQFLGKSLTDEQVETMRKKCSFEEMASNPSVNYSQLVERGTIATGNKFFRSGKVADWKNQLDDESNKLIEEYYEQNFKSKGLEFDFDI